jgi:hypothetical protein
MKLKNFSSYEIDVENGTVWSYKSNRFIGSPQENNNGYWYIGLMDDNGKPHTFPLHRVIWMSANGEIPEGLEVNHIDEDKSNNSLSNLNLMTPKENINFGTRTQRTSRQVAAYKDGVLVLIFSSTAEAGRNGFHQGAVSDCCNGIRQSHKGYTWKYTDNPTLFS